MLINYLGFESESVESDYNLFSRKGQENISEKGENNFTLSNIAEDNLSFITSLGKIGPCIQITIFNLDNSPEYSLSIW